MYCYYDKKAISFGGKKKKLSTALKNDLTKQADDINISIKTAWNSMTANYKLRKKAKNKETRTVKFDVEYNIDDYLTNAKKSCATLQNRHYAVIDFDKEGGRSYATKIRNTTTAGYTHLYTVSSIKSVAPHEVGHLYGLMDRYVEGTGKATEPQWQDNIMHNNNQKLEKSQLTSIIDWRTSEDWETCDSPGMTGCSSGSAEGK